MAGNPRPSRQPQAGATPDTAAGSGGDLPAPEYEQAGSGVQDLSVPAMAQGFLYLVVIMDWVSRAVLAWRLSNRSAPHPTIPYGWIEAPIRRNSASCSGFRGPLRLAELTAILPGHPDRVPTLPRSAGHLGMELCLGPVETVSLLREGPGGSNPLPPEESLRTIGSAGDSPCPRTLPSIAWSTWQSCDGGSSAIIRSSSRNSASVIMKGAGGAAFIITPHSVLPLTAF